METKQDLTTKPQFRSEDESINLDGNVIPTDWSGLHLAVSTGDLEAVKRLFKQHRVQLGQVGTKFKQSLIDLAAQNGDNEILEYLLNDNLSNMNSLDLKKQSNDEEIFLGKNDKTDIENGYDKAKNLLPEETGDAKNSLSQLYSKRIGTSGISGQRYEIYLLMWFLLQASKIGLKFHLATNMEEAEDFDDVVFKSMTETGKLEIIFLQAKHKDNKFKDGITFEQLLSDRGDFNLKKYFNCYRKIRQNFTTKIKNIIFSGKLEEVKLIIFTNAISDFSENRDKVEKLLLKENSVLNISHSNRHYQKLKIKDESNFEKIKTILYQTSECNRLAKELAEAIFYQRDINLNEGIFKNYQIPLIEQVLENDKNECGEGFLKRGFINNNCQFRNAFIDEIKKCDKEFDVKSENELILKLQNTKIKLADNFNKIRVKKGKCPEELPNDLVAENELHGFLENFMLFVNQPSEGEFIKIIKQKIGEIYKIEQQDIEMVFSFVKNKIDNWWKSGNYFLTEDNKLFEDALRISIRFQVKEPVTSFTGRESELKQLHEGLQNCLGKVTIISQITSISGLGGIGKTELSRQYIKLYGTEYYDGNVIWINGENEETIKMSFRKLANDQLKIVTTDANREEKSFKSIIEEVYQFFRKRKCLFIFDDAEPSKILKECLPQRIDFQNGKPHILITSRVSKEKWEYWGVKEFLALDVLNEIEAVQLIKQVLEIEETNGSLDLEIRELAIDVLGRFPLALLQAAAYIKAEDERLKRRGKGNYRVCEYLSDYKKQAKILLSCEEFNNKFNNDYTKTTYTTWAVSINKIKRSREYGQLALEALRIMAYVSPNNIPVENTFSLLTHDEEKLWNAVELLDMYSMITIHEGKADIHALVQEVTRIELEELGIEVEFIGKSYSLVDEYLKNDLHMLTTNEYMITSEMLPHVDSILAHSEVWLVNNLEDNNQTDSQEKGKEQDIKRFNINCSKVASSLLRLNTYYDNSYTKQNELLERILAMKEKQYGPNHDEVANTLVFIYEKLKGISVWDKRIEVLEKAKQIKETVYGSDHIEVGEILNKMSDSYSFLGDYIKQIECLERVWKIKEILYGPDHPEIAGTMENMGAAYNDLGDYKQQIFYLEESCKIKEKNYGINHIEIVSILNKIYDAYERLGDFQKLSELLERILYIETKYYGPKHFNCLQTKNRLNRVNSQFCELINTVTKKCKDFIDIGQLAEQCVDNQNVKNYFRKKEYLKKTLDVEKRFYGHDHIEVAQSLLLLGDTYHHLNKYHKQTKSLELAVQIIEKYYGSEHIQTANALNALSRAYEQLRDFQKEREILDKALSIKQKHYGPEHIDIANNLVKVSEAYGNLGEHQKQKEILDKALTIVEKNYGDDYIFAITTKDSANYESEKKHLEWIFEFKKKHNKTVQDTVAKTLYEIGILCRKLGDDKGGDFFENVSAFTKELYRYIDNPLKNESDTLFILSMYKYKIKSFEEPLIFDENYFGPAEVLFAAKLLKKSDAYKKGGNLKKSKEYLERALKINEKHFGAEHISVSTILESLSDSYKYQKEFQKEKDILEKILSMKEAHFGQGHISLVDTLEKLSDTYCKLDNNQKARELLEKACVILFKHESKNVKIYKIFKKIEYLDNSSKANQFLERILAVVKKLYGVEYNVLITILKRMCDAFKNLGDYRKEKIFLEKVLEVAEMRFGPKHIEIANTLLRLSDSYKNSGDYVKAQQLLTKLLAITEEHYGNEHHEVANILECINDTNYNLDLQKQKEYLEKAFTINVNNYGAEHFKVAKTFMKILEFKDDIKWETFLEKAVLLSENQYDVNFGVEVGCALENISEAFKIVNDHNKQIEFLENALQIKERHYGTEHAEVVSIIEKIKNAQKYLDDIKVGKGIPEILLPMGEKCKIPDQIKVSSAKSSAAKKDLIGCKYSKEFDEPSDEIANTLISTGEAFNNPAELQVQITFFKKALQIKEKLFGADDIKIVKTLEILSTTYKNLANFHLEKQYLEKALSILEKHYGQTNKEVVQILDLISDAHYNLKDYQRQIILLASVFAINVNIYGPAHYKVAKTLVKVFNLYEYGLIDKFFERLSVISEKYKRIEDAEVVLALTFTSRMFRNTGDYYSEKLVLKQALIIVEKRYGPKHNNLIQILISISDIWKHLENYQKQKTFLERAMTITEINHGFESEEISRVLIKMSEAYKNLGLYIKQKETLEKALAIKVKHNFESDEIATILVYISDAYRNLGEHYLEKEFLERAMAIRVRLYGPESISVASILQRISNAYRNLNDYKQQKKYLDKALAIKEKNYAPKIIKIANELVYKTAAYGSLDEYQRQNELLEKAFDVNMKQCGADHFKDGGNLLKIFDQIEEICGSKKRQIFSHRAWKIELDDEKEIASNLEYISASFKNLREYNKEINMLKSVLAIEEINGDVEQCSVADTLIKISVAYKNLKNYQKEKEFLERALAIKEKQYGDEHPEVACTLECLSETYGNLFDYQKQKKTLDKAFKINMKHAGLGHFNTIKTIIKIINVYKLYRQGKYKYLEKVLTISRKQFSAEHSEIVSSLLNISDSYRMVNDYLKEKEFFDKALTFSEKHQEPAKIINVLKEISNAYIELGNSGNAIVLLEKILELLKENYGPENAKVADMLEIISKTYGNLGDFKKKIIFLEKALEIRENHYGDEHATLARTLKKLSDTYYNLEYYNKHKLFLERALLIKNKLIETFSLTIANNFEKQSNYQGYYGNYWGQKEYLELALEYKLRHFGSDHIEIANSQLRLGNVHAKLRDFQKQLECFEKALPIKEKFYDTKTVEIADILENMSMDYRYLRYYSKEIENLEKSLLIKEELYGINHFETASTLLKILNATKTVEAQNIMTRFLIESKAIEHNRYNLLVADFGISDLYQKQKEISERLLTFVEKEFGPDHIIYAFILDNIGKVYGNLGDYCKKEEFEEKMYSIRKKEFGPEAIKIAKTITNLKTYQMQKKFIENVLAAREGEYGSERVMLAYIIENVSQAYINLGDYRKQTEFSKIAIPILEKPHERKTAELAKYIDNLNSGFRNLKDYNKRKELLIKALERVNKDFEVEHFEIAGILEGISNAYANLDDYLERVTFLEKALAIKEKELGAENVGIVCLLLSIGEARGSSGHSEEQKKVLERALSIIEKHYDPKDIDISEILYNLIEAYGYRDKFGKQEELLERALAIREKPQEVCQVIAPTNIYEALRILEGYQKQEELLHRAFTFRCEEFSPEYLKVAEVYVNISDAFKILGNYQKQKELLERALVIKEKHYGLKHENVARTVEKLSEAYHKLNEGQNHKIKLEAALPIKNSLTESQGLANADHFVRESNCQENLGNYLAQKVYLELALECKLKFHGPDHVEIADILTKISASYKNLGNNLEQIKYLHIALAIREKLFEQKHITIVNTLLSISDAFNDLGEYHKQKDLLEKIISTNLKGYSLDHILIARSVKKLCNALLKIGVDQTHKARLENALANISDPYQSYILSIAKNFENESDYEGNSGNYLEQIDYLQLALECRLLHHEHDQAVIADTLVKLSVTYKNLADYQTQLEYLKRVLEIRTKLYGIDHGVIASTYASISIVYKNLGNYKKQSEYLDKALKIRKKLLGTDHGVVFSTLIGVSNAYGKLNEYKKQDEYLQRALAVGEKLYCPEDCKIAYILELMSELYTKIGGESERQRDVIKRARGIRKGIPDYYAKRKEFLIRAYIIEADEEDDYQDTDQG